ncbi:hypothetical protein SRABI96_01248 [Peribacillus sp. Bi96]|nr:hypothetical protein SRABI96_01248 [Peribacillus sp. Bi96]
MQFLTLLLLNSLISYNTLTTKKLSVLRMAISYLIEEIGTNTSNYLTNE